MASEADDGWRDAPQFDMGDSPDMADELVALVLAGTKTATCWDARLGRRETEVGGRWVGRDGAGRPRVLVETVAIERRRFDEVDAAFAFDEGEDDRSLAAWRAGHQRYFTRNGGFAPDMPLWCERFRLVQPIPC